MEATPRPAATILLLRDGAAGMEVFMVVRHHEIAFAAGALVFPGGRVEPADLDLAARSATAAGIDAAALGLRVAAIRETFEECGVLLARQRGSADLIDGAALRRIEAAHRAALNAGSIGFEAMLLEEDLVPAADLLVPFAHWITPVSQPKRYDTHFFLAAAPGEHLAVHDGREAVESIWITPAQALAQTEAGRFRLIFAPAKNLEKLGRHTTVSGAITAAHRARIVTVMPEATKLDGVRRLMRIPVEADYGGGEFIIDSPPAS